MAERSAEYKEGVIDQRLAAFDDHFETINGSMERTADELGKLRLLVEEQLDTKVDRSRVHEIVGKMSAMQLELKILEETVVRREGPIVDRIDANMRRIEKIEAGQDTQSLKLKSELQSELQSLRESIKEASTTGSLRLWSAAGGSFAAVLLAGLPILKGLGFI